VHACVCVSVLMLREQGNWTGVTMNEETKSVLIFRFLCSQDRAS